MATPFLRNFLASLFAYQISIQQHKQPCFNYLFTTKTSIQLTIYQQVILPGFLFSDDGIGLGVPNETLLAYKPGEMIEGAPYPLVFLSTLLAREVTVPPLV